jgi:hypothetical protein
MTIKRQPEPPALRRPGLGHQGPIDPLTILLQEAIRRTSDPATHKWLRGLLNGDVASSQTKSEDVRDRLRSVE